jgi:propane monooxygenase small subunit
LSALRSTTSPSATCAHQGPCSELLSNDREFADHNKQIVQQWLSAWVPRAIAPPGRCSRSGHSPELKPPRFEDGLDLAKSRFVSILGDLGLLTPKELAQ